MPLGWRAATLTCPTGKIRLRVYLFGAEALRGRGGSLPPDLQTLERYKPLGADHHEMAETAKSVLEEIIALRRGRLEKARQSVPLDPLRLAAEARSDHRDFAGALAGKTLSVIAELKPASPSRGVLRKDYRPAEIAREYEAAKAAALSVLTEEDFFMGSLEHLRAADTKKTPREGERSARRRCPVLSRCRRANR